MPSVPHSYCAICARMGARIKLADGRKVHAHCRDGEDSRAGRKLVSRQEAEAHAARIATLMAGIAMRSEIRGPWPYPLPQ